VKGDRFTTFFYYTNKVINGGLRDKIRMSAWGETNTCRAPRRRWDRWGRRRRWRRDILRGRRVLSKRGA
jgi:hypothetical protein